MKERKCKAMMDRMDYLIKYGNELELVDKLLLAYLGRMWEQMRDILPAYQPITYSPEELRRSRLGKALVLITSYARGRSSGKEQEVQRTIKQVCRMFYGDPLSETFTLPVQFRKTLLGQLFNEVYYQMYNSEDVMTPVQAYRFLGIARQSLYDRLYDGKLTAIYWSDELRLLRSEIEEWKAQREERRETTKPKQERE